MDVVWSGFEFERVSRWAVMLCDGTCVCDVGVGVVCICSGWWTAAWGLCLSGTYARGVAARVLARQVQTTRARGCDCVWDGFFL